MDKGQPLHIKYRPKTLAEFMGNRALKDSLQSILDREEGLQRAILFTGPSGCGKTTLARIIKNKLGCSDMDFVELNAANVRGIDTIREIGRSSRFYPLSGKVKVYLFDEVHQVTKDAQNAMLKLLEDTPPYVYFILATTEPEKLLKTLKNRCAIYEVRALRKAEITALLNKVLRLEGVADFPVEAINQIVRVSEGSPRQALVILDQVVDITDEKILMEAIVEASIKQKTVIDLCRSLIKGDWEEVKQILKNLDEDPEKVRLAIANYLTSVLLNNGGKKIADMLMFFTDSFMYGGKPMLVSSCYLACNL